MQHHSFFRIISPYLEEYWSRTSAATTPFTPLTGCYGWNIDIVNFPWRCCCGRPENKHFKPTTVQEENEVAEVTSEIGGDVFNSSHNEEGVVETKGTVELQKGKGCCTKSDSLIDHIKDCHWFINWAQLQCLSQVWKRECSLYKWSRSLESPELAQSL